MIPLVVRSSFSLMWGTCAPETIVAVAHKRGYRSLALTDTDNVYGLWSFLKACHEYGVQPIVGAELTDPRTNGRAVILVENEEGWCNLSRLLTSRHVHHDFSLMSAVPAHARGLVVLTSQEDMLTWWRECGVSVAAALPRRPHGRAIRVRTLATRLGIPSVAVPSSFFLDPDQVYLHRMLRAIARRTTVSRLEPTQYAHPDAWLAPASEYARRFNAWPETITASEELAERLTFRAPAFGRVMPLWKHAPQGRSADEELRSRTYEGAYRRYGAFLDAKVVNRIEYELDVIQRMGFASYFLVVEDIVKRSPRICGRGSGAASIVAYALGITNVCPIKFNLYFERFLNPDRKDPPDIDVDFAWDERDEVISSVLKDYQGHAAMVAQFVTFGPRMAIREIAKVYGLSESEIGQMNKLCSRLWHWGESEADEEGHLMEPRSPCGRTTDGADPWRRVMRCAQWLIGTPRYLSLHPGGLVITPNPIDEYVPGEMAPKGVPVIQWDKDAVEAAGLVKIDLLGNRSLGVLRDALDHVRENGHYIDESTWEPEDDPATIATVARGETMGCFYIESPAMRLLQKKTRRGDYEHVVIHSSIIRPAANRYIREYVRRLHGGRWKPIDPLLEEVLHETYGLMVYQEDISRTVRALAGFSSAEADELRKVMSKKDPQRHLGEYYRRFVQGANARGMSDASIAYTWDMILSFEGYSFCKPHSASYARVSFQAAYLKTHFPAEFMAAVLSNQGGYYAPCAYVSEARRMGLTILPPEVNESCIRWRGKGTLLRVGWLSVRGLSRATAERIVMEQRRKPFNDIGDVLSRVRPGLGEARALIFSRAFETLHPGEPTGALLWELAWWTKRQKGLRSAVADLWARQEHQAEPPVPEEGRLRRLRREFGVLGFLCDCHPMSLFADVLEGRGCRKAQELGHFVGQRVHVAGFLTAEKIVATRKGELMEFVTFEDETGLIETVCFPGTYRRFSHMLDHYRPFVLGGILEEDYGVVTLTVDHVEPIHPLSVDDVAMAPRGSLPTSEKSRAVR